MTGPAATIAATAPIPSRLDRARPYIGLLGVMLGAMMATLGARITTFGLADIRGNLGIGFDEGAWITTMLGLGQMISGISCPYLSSLVGGRRMLLAGILTLFVASLLAPLSPNLPAYLTAQFFAGLGSGTFIPLTIIFIIRYLPKHLLIYGIAVYGMNLEFSQNISASLEGFYVETLSWHWMSWQFCLLLPPMFACVLIGMPRDGPIQMAGKRVDGIGIAYAWLGFGALYVALDHGNRLDWLGSGLINGLLVVAAVAIALFLIRELRLPAPAVDLRVLAAPGLIVLFLMLSGFRFIILSTAYVIPNYLQVVQGYRALDVGAVLVWIALPQVALVLPVAMLLQRIDPRWTLGTGAALIAAASLMATRLTADWATADFLPSQIVQAVGQSLALASILVLAVRTIRPEQAVTIGSFMQISRLLGGEAGIATMQTLVRMREQVHSNLLGLHVQGQDHEVGRRLAGYAGALADQVGATLKAAASGLELLALAVARQAYVLAFIDAFQATAVVALLCWLLAAFVPRPAPVIMPAMSAAARGSI